MTFFHGKAHLRPTPPIFKGFNRYEQKHPKKRGVGFINSSSGGMQNV